MPFKPINPRNAILEAVVVVHLNRPVFEFEAVAVRALHPKLARDLPRLDPVQVGTIYFGQGEPPPHPPGAPVVMAAFKRDGTLETRLLLNGPMLTVNFLLYTRWGELWPKAAFWIQESLDAAATAHQPGTAPPLEVIGLTHHIVDVFRWRGPAESISVVDLFTDKPPRLPEAAWTATGSPWQATHSVNERFSLAGLPPSTLADHLSVDLGSEEGVGWRLRLEHVLEARFSHSLFLTGLFSRPQSGGMPLAETVMDEFHVRNRLLVQSLFRPDVLSRIGLETS